MSTMMSMDLPFQPPPNEAYELLNGIKQGERVYAPINLASPLPSSPSPDLASAKSTTSAAGPLTLQQQQQQRPPPPQTLPPDYRSIPKSPLPSSNRNANADGNDSNPAGSNRINRQEEKQALRDSRAFLAQELEQNKGQLSLSPKHLQTRSIEPSSNSSYSNSNSISEPTSNGSSQERRRSTDQLLTINVDQGTPLISQQEQGERQEQGPEQEQSQEKVDRGAEEVLQEGSNNDDLQLGHRGYLPRGMDVRDALARCEDPTLGWSLQFWVTIADPMTQHVFFACPASGQCSWDPPIGAFVVPRSPDGEWWELADSTRGNRSYYYNTLTGRTQWTRPGGNAFVIPLGLIQAAALPKLEDPSTSSRIIPSTPTHNRASGVSHLSPIKTPSPTSRGYPRPPHSPYSIPRPVHSPSKSNRSSTLSPSSSYGPSQTLEAIVLGHFASGSSYVANGDSPSPTKATDHTVSEGTATSSSQPTSLSASGSGQTNGSANAGPGSRNQLTIVEEGSGNETDMSDMSFSGGGTAVGSSGWWEKRKSQVLTVKTTLSSPRRRLKSTGPGSDGTSPVDPVNALVSRGSPLRKGPGRGRITGPIMEHNESTAESTENGDVIGQRNGPGPSLPKVVSAEPIYVDHVGSVKTKRMSTGLHPLLPSEISNEILAFQAEDFARKYFATKRSGVLRQKVPVERIMEWQRTAISSPILVLSRHLQKDGITTFKVIQHVMGERERAVEGAKPMMSSSSHLNLASLALGGRKGDEGHPQRVGSGAGALDVGGGRSEKMQVLEEIRWMIQLCVAASEMRDEVYCQLVKQLTRNPNHDAVVLGFQLFCVLTNAFGPSKNFEPFVRNFLNSHKDDAADGIGVMAKYCMTKLESLAAKGARSKALTIGEIEHASDAAFYPSVYGESLDRIMELQKRAYPTLKVPVILPFLADGILALGGLQSEGIFRVPGDGDSVAELKSRMDRGHYQLKGIEDPHVAASLFKLWLRELEDPIVPSSLYNEALIASKSATESIDFVNRLPTYNRRVLLFVISFVQLFMGRGVVEKTKMTPGNLALVIAPNILRTTSNSLVTVFTNSSFESKFILQLLENMDTSIVDEGYVPSHGQAIGRV
ncbi:hypothetical protein I317_00589 [Kwoniella heveanensis CBS 569]|nr:hypothetical protein I317_00589 [Kwoniella heveanensis CBS 569]